MTLAFLALASSTARGAALALAASAKFAPLALAPLLASYRDRRLRDAIALLARVRGRAGAGRSRWCVPDGGVREL